MRILIDGYNLMHAAADVPARLGPDGLRRIRQRFLNDLAHRLGPLDAAQTTVVFDAKDPPEGRPRRVTHKGLTVLYAIGEEGADAGLEAMIAADSAPKGLLVVSSDHRIRRAASRRKAQVRTSDEFWTGLSRPKARAPETPAPSRPERPVGMNEAESAYWREQFKDVIGSTEDRELGRRPDFLPSDEEVERIAREVEEEDL